MPRLNVCASDSVRSGQVRARTIANSALEFEGTALSSLWWHSMSFQELVSAPVVPALCDEQAPHALSQLWGLVAGQEACRSWSTIANTAVSVQLPPITLLLPTYAPLSND
jgi:hypothetical protein